MNNAEREKIFLNFFEKGKSKIYRLCYGYVKDKSEVDDLFQEVMINVWNNLHKFRNESKIDTWVYRIAVNTALLFIKKDKKKDLLTFEDSASRLMEKPEDALVSEEKKEQEEKLNKLHKCIATLKKMERLIISLLLEGMSYENIAEIVGISDNYVGVKINRIKSILEKKMEETSYE